jgi:hypothetical protein
MYCDLEDTTGSCNIVDIYELFVFVVKTESFIIFC